MASVLCFGWFNAFSYQSAALEAGVGGVSGYWWRMEGTTSHAEARHFAAPSTTFPQSGFGTMSLPTANTSVEPGALCPPNMPNGTPVAYVVMPIADYKNMIDSAKVVEEIQRSTDYGLIAVVALCVIAGIFFGWHVVGRGEGRSS